MESRDPSLKKSLEPFARMVFRQIGCLCRLLNGLSGMNRQNGVGTANQANGQGVRLIPRLKLLEFVVGQ